MTPTNRKSKPAKPQDTSLLQGWTAIAGFLGLPTATAQRWARSGMPVRKEGRFTIADKSELQQWLGRESHMPAPAQVVGKNTDLASALKAIDLGGAAWEEVRRVPSRRRS